jgi:hypothetical protein
MYLEVAHDTNQVYKNMKRITLVMTIVTFCKTDFVLRKPGRYDLNASFVAEIEAEYPFRGVKQIEVWEWYSDNTSDMVDWYVAEP